MVIIWIIKNMFVLLQRIINNLIKTQHMKAKKIKAKAESRVRDWENNLSKKGPGYKKPGSQKK